MIVVIDYGMGNVGSILNMLKKVGAVAKLSSQPDDLLQADRLILPGVGSFDAGMNNLKGMGCVDALNRRVLQDRIPILGICLGMQLFSKRSEEGIESGLGWLDADTIHFRFNTAEPQLKIPHMGWDNVQVCTPSSIFPESRQERRFYFVHSYHVKCNEAGDVLTTTHYGCDFASSVCRGNILGMQFHPEKSHRFGLEAFRNFLSWVPDSK